MRLEGRATGYFGLINFSNGFLDIEKMDSVFSQCGALISMIKKSKNELYVVQAFQSSAKVKHLNFARF